MSARVASIAVGIAGIVALLGAASASAVEEAEAVDITVEVNDQFSGTVARFETFTPTPTSASDFSATIDWGDNTPASGGTVVEVPENPGWCPDPGPIDGAHQCYEVRGTHTYSAVGAYATLTSVTNAEGTETLYFAVGDATVTALIQAMAGTQFTEIVAAFRSPGGTTAAGFTASIDWGDSSAPSAGTIVQRSSCPGAIDAICYDVQGTHTYPQAGEFAIGVTVTGPDPTRQIPARATVSGTAPPPPPPPPPEPGPGPGPTARLSLAQANVKPGALAVLDASQSSGQIAFFAFDINGNGTFETKCDKPYAGVVSAALGQKQLGVKAVGADGSSSVAKVSLNVGGKPAKPPKGRAPLKKGTEIADCLSEKPTTRQAQIDGFLATYLCPQTVKVGVAEATVPFDIRPYDSGPPCFKREDGPKDPRLKAPGGSPYPRFVAHQSFVLLNGIEINTSPGSSNTDKNLVISEGRKEVTQLYPGAYKVEMRLQREGVGSLISEWFKFGTWNVANPGVVGHFPIEDYFSPRVIGLPVIPKDVPITSTKNYESRLQVFVTPPFDFSSLRPNNSPTGQPLNLIADNTDGLRVEGGSVVSGGGSGTYHLDMPLGIFHLTGTLFYSNEGGSNVWQGNIKLVIPNTPVQNITGFIRFRDGSLERAHVSMPFAGDGLGPLLPPAPIFLSALAGTLTSSYIQADAEFTAGPTLFGHKAARANASMNINYSPFVLVFNANQLKILIWNVKANVQVLIKPDLFMTNAFWGPVDFGPLTNFRVNVWVQIGNPWGIAGSGTGCFQVFIPIGCAKIAAAAGPKGITGCAGVKIAGKSIAGGIVMPWNPLKFWDWSGYWGCSFELAKSEVGAAQAATLRARAAARAAAASYPVKVPKGAGAGLFVIEGKGGKPLVRLRGPDGTEITPPGRGEENVQDDRWLAISDTNDNSVHVVVVKPAAGTWRVAELAASPPVRAVRFAESLPGRFARGKVTGRGRSRTLSYRVKTPPGTQVRFVERAGQRPRAGEAPHPARLVENALGRATSRRGKIRFTATAAKIRKRGIEAEVISQGVPIKTERVTTFTAPKFSRPAAPYVKVRRRGGDLVANWSKVLDAHRYQAFVNRRDGQTRFFSRARGARTVRLKGITALTSARVEVRAVSGAGYIGKPGVARLRRLPAVSLPKRLSTAGVLRRGGFGARCTAAGNGVCRIVVRQGGRPLAVGSKALKHGQRKRVNVRLAKSGRKTLQKARRSGQTVAAKATFEVPGTGPPRRPVRFRCSERRVDRLPGVDRSTLSNARRVIDFTSETPSAASRRRDSVPITVPNLR